MRISSSKLKVVFKFNTTAHEVRQRARCHNCGVKGNNTYQIVFTGKPDFAMGSLNYSIVLLRKMYGKMSLAITTSIKRVDFKKSNNKLITTFIE